MASIGSLTADLRLQSAAFIRDLNRASQAVASNTAAMRRSMRQVEAASRNVSRQFAQVRGAALALGGALAVRQFTGFTRTALENADAIAKTARRMGLYTETLQETRIAAAQLGVEQKQLDVALTALIRRQGEAIEGNKEFAAGFARVGLTVQDLKRLTPERLILQVADGLSQIENQALRVAAADRIMSEAGRQVINVFSGGAGAIEAYAEQARQAGLIMEGPVLAAAERLSDDLTLLNTAFRTGFDTAIIEGLSGTLDSTAASLREAREIGEDFGRGVGTAMRLVAAAGAFVARNIRALAAALAAVIALKAAGLFIALAAAVGRFALAMVAAARATNLLNQLLSRSVLGLVARLAITLGAAALTWEAFGEAAAATANDIERAARGIVDVGEAGEDASNRVETLTASLERERNQLTLLARAHVEGAQAVENANDAIEVQNLLVRENLDANSAAGREITALVVANNELKRGIERVTSAQEARARASEKAAEDAKNAARDLGLTFSSAFEDAVASGARFRDILQGIERDLIRLAVRRFATEPFLDAIGGIDFASFFGAGASGPGPGAGPPLRGSVSGGTVSAGGFATGGAFIVPGAGGPDSQRVILDATPGERVRIETPAQQRAQAGAVTVTVINNAGAEVGVREGRGASGGVSLEVTIDKAVADALGRRGSQSSQTLERVFGARRSLSRA